MEIKDIIIQKTLRVPTNLPEYLLKGDGASTTRQLDIALMSVGFKLSQELLEYFNNLHPTVVISEGENILEAVRKLVGDDVKHNVYFKEFPANVPDTVEFWAECITDALQDPDAAMKVMVSMAFGYINLLDLPKYGRYQHSYEEMVAVHKQFLPSIKDRVTILHKGQDELTEAHQLYLSMASSNIPFNREDQKILEELANVCAGLPQPESVPVREHRAVINKVRIKKYCPIIIDTVTDVLRLAYVLSSKEASLEEPQPFKSFSRPVRRILLKALDDLIEQSPTKLADVNQYREQWKRLGERLHPYEYKFPHAQEVFNVARGDKKVLSHAAKVERAFQEGNIEKVISLLAKAPGMLFRSLDRILSYPGLTVDMTIALMEALNIAIPKVSTRVLLSVNEHLTNRVVYPTENIQQVRLFINRKGKAWATLDTRKALSYATVTTIFNLLDKVYIERLLEKLGTRTFVFDPLVRGVALPISSKTVDSGFNIMPRGSCMTLTKNEILRFFMYWKETEQCTDYDLSLLLLNKDFGAVGHISYTHLKGYGIAHSGDITESAKGATEFINVELSALPESVHYLIPQVNVFNGEGFLDVEQSFFGFMELEKEQEGKPFEPATVRIKSDIRGKGQVALPIVFIKGENSTWFAKWLHLYLTGDPRYNRIEVNRITTSLLTNAIIQKTYLRVEYLLGALHKEGCTILDTNDTELILDLKEPVVYIGIEVPELSLPEGSKVITLRNLHEVV